MTGYILIFKCELTGLFPVGAIINSSEQTVTHGFKNYLLNFSVRHDEIHRGNDSLSNALAKKKIKRGEMNETKSVMGGSEGRRWWVYGVSWCRSLSLCICLKFFIIKNQKCEHNPCPQGAHSPVGTQQCDKCWDGVKGIK